ncbi:MAG TPA: FAD-dependent oxidoreductase [Oscillospiraceae bacterium]|nr:FAD-dependent oxidoreductase [Oscillospiraceae bacterium]
MEKYDVVVIGAGPAGIFTALEIYKHASPDYKVLVVDEGISIARRKCPARSKGVCVNCKPCNIMSGWAGAGAFSDGKLSLCEEVGGNLPDYLPIDKLRKLIKYTDQIYLEHGAPDLVHGLNDKKAEEIAYECSKHNIKLIRCPVRHLGTENAYDVLKAMYDHLEPIEGFSFLEKTHADPVIKDGKAVGVKLLSKDGSVKEVAADYVVAAPGRGGAKWLNRIALENGIKVQNNEVDIGVRVEVPNSIMDKVTKHLYEAKMVYYSDTFENKVRTFCMNPGGMVSEEHYNPGFNETFDRDLAVVNGHSYADQASRTENTNFALLVSTRFTQPFDQPIEYGRYIAQLGNMLTGGGVMVQRLGDLLMGRRTDMSRLRKSTTRPTLTTAVPGDLSFVLPHRHLTSIIEALRAFDKVVPGLYSKNTLLYGVEVKFYSSKLEVNDKFETKVKNLYAIGDGAGITRGLMQASVTGVLVAREILGIKED